MSSMDELTDMVKENRLSNIEHMGVSESSWDPHDDDAYIEVVLDYADRMFPKCIRAVMELMMKEHFREAIFM